MLCNFFKVHMHESNFVFKAWTYKFNIFLNVVNVFMLLNYHFINVYAISLSHLKRRSVCWTFLQNRRFFYSLFHAVFIHTYTFYWVIIYKYLFCGMHFLNKHFYFFFPGPPNSSIFKHILCCPQFDLRHPEELHKDALSYFPAALPLNIINLHNVIYLWDLYYVGFILTYFTNLFFMFTFF